MRNAMPLKLKLHLVDLLYHKLYNKSTTSRHDEILYNKLNRWILAHNLLWTCCTVQANHGREFT